MVLIAEPALRISQRQRWLRIYLRRRVAGRGEAECPFLSRIGLGQPREYCSGIDGIEPPHFRASLLSGRRDSDALEHESFADFSTEPRFGRRIGQTAAAREHGHRTATPL